MTTCARCDGDGFDPDARIIVGEHGALGMTCDLCEGAGKRLRWCLVCGGRSTATFCGRECFWSRCGDDVMRSRERDFWRKHPPAYDRFAAEACDRLPYTATPQQIAAMEAALRLAATDARRPTDLVLLTSTANAPGR